MTRDRIDRVKFRDLLHDHFDMSDDFFMDRGLTTHPPSLPPSLLISIIVFIVFRAFDRDSDSFLTQEEWVKGMSIFLRGSLDEKVECKSIITS